MGLYRGRLAPTPTGWLHAGHAATFFAAQERAAETGGVLIYRQEDLDMDRCRREFALGALEDLYWLGIRWKEGIRFLDCGGGIRGPYEQRRRRTFYLDAWRKLRDGGWIYPSSHSRKDVALSVSAPHEEEPVFPVEWRQPVEEGGKWSSPAGINWRFRVPDGEKVTFQDGRHGVFSAEAGRDFGDFVVWRRDDCPAYELAVVADDIAMGITEVVRGEDLLLSTCRQLLLYRALESPAPDFFHTPLVRDSAGRRLAKRDQSASIRQARQNGIPPDEFRRSWGIAV